MSKRADYDLVSTTYDTKRSASGSDVMVALMQFYSGKQTKDLHVLDAGCGTGNYTKGLIDYGIRHVTLLDFSSGMLETARIKLDQYVADGTVHDIVETSMPPIPFPDACFDVVMLNMVINHLDEADDKSFPRCIETLKESKRVIKPNGIILISTVLKSTVLNSMWFTKLDANLGERFAKNLHSLEQLQFIFLEAGISCKQKMNILSTDMYKNYYNLESMDCVLYDIFHYLNYTEAERNEVEQRLKS